jgi:hypothetical protein
MTDYRFRWACVVLSLVALVTGWVYYFADDTPSPWVLIYLIATGGTFALLARD